ncbi:AzlC family ABC transporter permease [Heliorestis convoluta]|uniref:AzlC family ABC transporter permease n=1 Tax=Heliorestis convoluta TaxID=356322 RepID=A0A5Q2NAE1_9FIRM|nr:AzlC family ABC transporter permease [Heliorestis convoluta]QGG49425.1 AzlC family ABC transporter permease [Heliorestis convoluta]
MTSLTLRDGIKAAFPIAIGYIPIAITFGVVARSAGIPDSITMLLSFLVFAGASQFIAVNLISLGSFFGEIVLTTFMLNLRHLLMSASLSQRLEGDTPRSFLPFIAFGLTDESFSVATLRKEAYLTPIFLLGLNFTAYIAWVGGTWLGLLLASGLPVTLQASMGIALYAMFIGLIVPALKTSRPFVLVFLLAAATHILLTWLPFFAPLSVGWSLLLSALVAAFVGAMIDQKEGAPSSE